MLGSEIREVVRTQLQLAGMEARRAGESLVCMITFGIFAACLIFTAWALMVAAGIIALVNSGLLSITSALLIVALGHLVIALYIVKRIKRYSHNLMFSLTSRNC